ncbi:MAG: homocysteine S-methyltransferase family protein, partial [Chloroflexota bacterium]
MSAKYRTNLPQLNGKTFLTDGGIETTLIFHDGLDLPLFSAFVLLDGGDELAALKAYFERYAAIARENETGFILESPTWRASHGWGAQLGYSVTQIADYNRRAIDLMQTIRDAYETDATPMPISGCIGPQGDGYSPETMMSAEAAQAYHTHQVETFARTDADMVTAITMTYAEEAIGITRAAQSAGMPVVISFTVETDGKLPSGQPLHDTIMQVDAATNYGPVYYMINCAHPTHFEQVLTGAWVERIRGLRANASTMSHAELDEAEELDAGDPVDLGYRYNLLKDRLPNLTVLGGCCGTDHRHIEEIY